jgi:hypothetical protein
VVCRQIGIDVGDMPYCFILGIPVDQFLHVFCMKESRLIGQYALA